MTSLGYNVGPHKSVVPKYSKKESTGKVTVSLGHGSGLLLIRSFLWHLCCRYCRVNSEEQLAGQDGWRLLYLNCALTVLLHTTHQHAANKLEENEKEKHSQPVRGTNTCPGKRKRKEDITTSHPAEIQ